MIIINPKTKAEVDAIKECIDLLHNGYFILFSCGERGDAFIRLRHSKNGRMLTFRIRLDGYTISENGKVIKEVNMSDRLVSD